MSDLVTTLRSELNKGNLKIPDATHDKVYKDECMYSFDSPFSDTGLYVNLNTFQGVGAKYLLIDAKKSRSKLYLNQKWSQVLKEDETKDKEDATEPSKLAIGVEGGFMSESKYDIVKKHSLVVLTESGSFDSYPFPECQKDIPEFIANIIHAVIKHEGMKSAMQVTSWDADNEKIKSKYATADMPQINPDNITIPHPKQWKDMEGGDTENLWLNLSTGHIGGGRKNWDGSGGSGTALTHYINTGKKYPLAVKLGTITPHGADVWSYADDEDCAVIDPFL